MLASMSHLWTFVQADRVRLLGGEPLLHPKLGELCRGLRRLEPRPEVVVVTNGARLERFYERARGSDAIEISKYPGVVIPSDEVLQQIAAELTTRISIRPFDSFQAHRATQPHTIADEQRVFDTCMIRGPWSCHTVRMGVLYVCPAEATWGRQPASGLKIDGELTEQAALEALSPTAPLPSCATCTGSAGRKTPHKLGWGKSPVDSHGFENAIDFDLLATLERDGPQDTGAYGTVREVHEPGS